MHTVGDELLGIIAVLHYMELIVLIKQKKQDLLQLEVDAMTEDVIRLVKSCPSKFVRLQELKQMAAYLWL